MKKLDEMNDAERKGLPFFWGVVLYFPNALALCANQSKVGQDQYAPDEPLQWFREKSQDELGSLSRHLLDYSIAWIKRDYAGMLAATQAIVWRALAHAERFLATTDIDPEHYQAVKRLRGESTEPEGLEDLCEVCDNLAEIGYCHVLSKDVGLAQKPLRPIFKCDGFKGKENNV